MRQLSRRWSLLGAILASSTVAGAQSRDTPRDTSRDTPRDTPSDTVPTKRWALEAFANAGAAVWSQPILTSRLSSVPAGGAGLALSHVHNAKWRGTIVLDDAKRGADGYSWRFDTRYTELAVLAYRKLFDAGPVAISLGGGPAIAWPRKGEAIFQPPPRYVQQLDLSPQEYHARMALEARTRSRIPIAGRVTFQRGINRILHSNPGASNHRWDGTTPPYNKLLGFEVGATILRW